MYAEINTAVHCTGAVNTVKTNMTSSPLLTRANRSSLLLLLSADHEKWYVPRKVIPMILIIMIIIIKDQYQQPDLILDK